MVMNNQRGFTLTELLVVLAVLALVLTGLVNLQQQGQAAYLIGAGRVEVQQNARYALERLSTELRFAKEITDAPSCGTGPVPSAGGATSITFTDQSDNILVYSVAQDPDNPNPDGPPALWRNGTVVIGGIDSLRIWCLNADGNLTASLSSTKAVRVQIATQTEFGETNQRNQHAVFDTQVRLRNVL